MRQAFGIKKNRRGLLFLCVALTFLSMSLGLCLGSVAVPLKNIPGILLRGPGVQSMDTAGTIIWVLRFPRVVLAFLEGAGLSMAGAVMQGLFRNPMADPFILGVSSAASLGAVIGIVSGIAGILGTWAIPGFAFLAACLTMSVVYRLATRGGKTETFTLLLSGIASSSLISSLITLIMVISRDRMDEIVFWTLGALSRATWISNAICFLYVLVGGILLFSNARYLNALSFGEEPAYHMGVPVQRVKRTLIWTSSLVTAAGVAFTGPIGFIGLIVPHAARFLVGPDHRQLLPFSAIIGGNSLVLADLLARTIVSPREMPVGVVTALFGAPFFLFLLYRARSNGQ
jgi:iron complex transport system permease protein